MQSMKHSFRLASLVAALAVAGCGPKLPGDVVADSVEAAALRADLAALAGPGATASTAAVTEPTGWATLTGTFRLAGAAPKASALKVDKETDVCAPGGMSVDNPILKFGPNGELGSVLVYLSTTIPVDNPKWVHESYDATKNAEVIFDQKACLFLSQVRRCETRRRSR